MFYKKISSALLTFLFCSGIFYGCSDDSIISSGQTVTGKLSDHANVPVSGIKVKIGDKTTSTAEDGSFKFDNITFPYDLALIDTRHKAYFLYKGVSASDLKFPNYYYSPDTRPEAVINVSIPNEILQPGVKGKIVFTDGSEINRIQDLTANSNLVFVTLSEMNKNYTGKLIVLTYSVDNNGNILGYENYGESESITINSSSNFTYSFTPAQLSLNPDEENIKGSFTYPSGYHSDLKYFYLAFNTKQISYISSLVQFSQVGDVFDFPVPANLSPSLSIIVCNLATDGSKNAFECYKVDRNSNGINLQTKVPPALISPENNATDIKASTMFSFNHGDGNGVFTLEFVNVSDNSRYFITTESGSIAFSEIMNLDENNISNTDFNWFAGKRGTCSGINEYMTSYTDSQVFFNSNSELRNFTTGE